MLYECDSFVRIAFLDCRQRLMQRKGGRNEKSNKARCIAGAARLQYVTGVALIAVRVVRALVREISYASAFHDPLIIVIR